jgi:hypothetical protein
VLQDFDSRLENFVDAKLVDRGRIAFLPGLTTTFRVEDALGQYVARRPRPGFVAVSADSLESVGFELLDALVGVRSHPERPLLIVSVTRNRLFFREDSNEQPWRRVTPDIVVCDESFAEFGVPLGAFLAPPHLYAHWNNRRTATFHSTTYQPNTVSTLHFMNVLRRAEPEFIRRHGNALRRINDDLAARRDSFGRRYSPSLAKLIDRVGLNQRNMQAEGHVVQAGTRRLFDAVAGVACSVRGHNPQTFADDIRRTGAEEECREELQRRVHELTDMPHLLPAVSGASAVEQALKLGLVAAFPKTHVLALEGGYGGKTLFALTGTAKSSLKAGLAPLYPQVTYIDPFASDARGSHRTALCRASGWSDPNGTRSRRRRRTRSAVVRA